MVQAIGLVDVGADGFCEEVRRHQSILQPGEDAVFQCGAADGVAVGAGAGVDMLGASEAALAAQRVGPAADAAVDQPREQRLRPVRAVQAVGLLHRLYDAGVLDRDLALTGLHRPPQLRRHDGEFRHLPGDPGLWRIEAGDASAGRGVLHVALPVPDQPTDIELVVDQACAALLVAANGGRAPEPAARSGHAFGVEPQGDGLGTDAVGEVAEHATHDFSLGRIDGAFAPNRLALAAEALDDIVAVAEASAGSALFDPSAQAASGLVGEILQEEGVHRALQADVEFGHLALGEGNDAHADELQVLVQRGDIGLVARDAVQRFGHDDVELAALGVLEQRLDAGAQDDAGAGDCGVAVGADDSQAVAGGLLAADAQLIVDRGGVLLVAGIAGVEGDAGHAAAPACGAGMENRRLGPGLFRRQGGVNGL
nr:hypothetical protein [Brevundimonas aurantiaca]